MYVRLFSFPRPIAEPLLSLTITSAPASTPNHHEGDRTNGTPGKDPATPLPRPSPAEASGWIGSRRNDAAILVWVIVLARMILTASDATADCSHP